jgi:hypothetical protein
MKRLALLLLVIAATWAIAEAVGYFLANLPHIIAAAVNRLEMLGMSVLAVAGSTFTFIAAPKFVKTIRKLTSIRHQRAVGTTSPNSARRQPEPGNAVTCKHEENLGRTQPLLILPLETYTAVKTDDLPCITIIVEPVTNLPADLDGSKNNRSVHEDSADILVIGDHTKVRSKVEYKIKELRVDTKGFYQRLPAAAREALSRLAQNPADTQAKAAFKRSLPRHDATTGTNVARFHTAAEASIDVVRCDILAVGNHNSITSTTERRISIGTINLQNLLSMHDDLIVRFAQALHDSKKEALFNQLLNRTVDMMKIITDPGFEASSTVRSATRTATGAVRLGEPIAVARGSGTRTITTSTAKKKRIQPVPDLEDIRKDLDLDLDFSRHLRSPSHDARLQSNEIDHGYEGPSFPGI